MLNGRRQPPGISLIEVILASTILSGMMLAGAFILQNLGRVQRQRDLRQVAQRFALDQAEILKSHPFANIYATAEEDAPISGCLRGSEAYDRDPDQFPPEILRWGPTSFRRQTCVETARFDTRDGELVRASPDSWTGLKRIVIRVRWPAERPKYEEEMETVMKDPAGPLTVARSTGSLTASVACTDLQKPAEPCAKITFYLTGSDGALRDVAISDKEGNLVFSKVPLGLSTIRPQLETGESSSPSEYAVTLADKGGTLEAPIFTITRTDAVVTLTSNRENTLVVAVPGPPEDAPPPVALRTEADPGIYSQIVSEKETLRLAPGTYSFRCWWTDLRGRFLMMDPPGGLNALLRTGDSHTYSCRFDE